MQETVRAPFASWKLALLAAVLAATLFVSGNAAVASVAVDLSPGSGPPPATLGPYTMTPFDPDSGPNPTNSAPAPAVCGGAVDFDQDMARGLAGTHIPWAHGYTGDVYAGNAPMELTLPAGTKAFSFYVRSANSAAAHVDAVANGGSATASVDLADGDPGYIGFHTAGGELLTSISITFDSASGGSLMFVGEFTISCEPTTDLALTKSATPATVAPGGLITYTLTAENMGPDPARSLRVREMVPAGTRFVSARVVSGSGWVVTAKPSPGATGYVTFANSAPTTGDTAMFEIVVRVNHGTQGTITNTATLESVISPGSTAKPAKLDPDPTNNTATVEVLVGSGGCFGPGLGAPLC